MQKALQADKALVRIIVVGDTCPIERNEKLLLRSNTQALLNDLLPGFEKIDPLIVNLECSPIPTEAPIEKCVSNLGAPVDCAQGLEAMGVDALGLANSHIIDHGSEGQVDDLRGYNRA